MRLKIPIFWKPKWPEIDGNTAILWEPCSNSHGEIVPGYAKYLLDLGYEVLVLLTPKRLDEGLFSRFHHERLRFGTLSQRQIKRFMRSGIVSQAAVVLISTVGKLPHKKNGAPDIDAVFGTNKPSKLLLVEHDAKSKIDQKAWRDNYITLAKLNYQNSHSTVINPHYFGAYETDNKTSEIVNFLIVGAARSQRRNISMLFGALERLVQNGHHNFTLKMIGKKDRTAIPEAIRNNVQILGHLDFKDLYREVEMADFLVTAFEKHNPDHQLYRSVKTSGSTLLAYGFNKPMIIQKEFEKVTALNEKNSIMYDENSDLYGAMLRAIEMSSSELDAMKQQLLRDTQELYQISLNNLNRLIDE